MSLFKMIITIKYMNYIEVFFHNTPFYLPITYFPSVSEGKRFI